MRVATLGPRGTYSEQAALLFARRNRLIPDQITMIYTTVNHSLRMVQNLEADYAVLPAENMIDGLIGSSFDALIEYQDFVKVCDEIHLPIHHVLVGPPEIHWDEVETIYSHPSALNQCQNQLADLFPRAQLIPVLSTALAAETACNDPLKKSAAICSTATTKTRDMSVYPGEIQDYTFNETRFLVCGLTDGAPTGNDRTLLAVRYGPNQPGQLHQTTKALADMGINLTFIQSRPYKIRPQEYVLIFELIGHKSNSAVESALKSIEMTVRTFNGWKKILGSYPKREREELHDIPNNLEFN